MNEITQPSYAKVNLFLDIVDIRPDGYHNLEMINAKISLRDTVSCRLLDAPGIELACSDLTVPTDAKNTAYKAAQWFFETIGQPPAVSVQIEKHIPHGAGLGGGSSNAAVVLQLLNRLHGEPLSLPELCGIGVRIGADVPFFLYDGICRLSGIGETIEAIPCPAEISSAPHAVLLSPSVGVSTKDAYGLWDRSDDPQHSSPGAMQACIAKGWLDEVHEHLFNSFETEIYPAYLAIYEAYEDFCDCCPTRPLLSGSGSNLFALVADEGEAEETVEELVLQGYRASAHRLLI